MLNKKLLMILCLFLIIISTACISAEDNNINSIDENSQMLNDIQYCEDVSLQTNEIIEENTNIENNNNVHTQLSQKI